MSNAPTELDLLRRVASAAAWAIQSNGDDVVGRDGRARVGINWTMANGELHRSLKALREHYAVDDMHADKRAEAASIEDRLMTVRKRKT